MARTVLFGCVWKSAVFESFPALIAGSENLIGSEVFAEPEVQVLVEQHFHFTARTAGTALDGVRQMRVPHDGPSRYFAGNLFDRLTTAPRS
jgi:hypothetical protein